MRVGVLLEQALAPVPGGTGRYAGELAAGLARTAAPTDAVRGVVAWHRRTDAARRPGVEGPRRLPYGRRVLAEAWARGTGPRLGGVDLVHAPTLLVPRVRAGVRLVVTVHDAVPWTHPETLTPRGAAWHRVMAERALEQADAVVVVSEAVGVELTRLWGDRVAGRLHVLGAGVGRSLTTAAGAADAAARRARLLPPGDRPYVLTLATLEPRKGLDVAVAALARLPEPGRPRLVSIGAAGWGGVDLAGAAAAAGLRPEDVVALGRLADADMAAVMAGADAVLVPSRAEGFGLPVAEAMAVGVAVVVTAVPALVETAGGAAVVVPVDDTAALADAVASLRDDPAARAALVEAGRRRAAHHDWDAVARRAWDLYREILVRPATGSVTA